MDKEGHMSGCNSLDDSTGPPKFQGSFLFIYLYYYKEKKVFGVKSSHTVTKKEKQDCSENWCSRRRRNSKRFLMNLKIHLFSYLKSYR